MTIEAKIDEAFRNKFLLPREKAVTDFFTDVLHSKYKFREDDTKIEVVGLYYYAASPLSFLFAMPHYEYYSQDKTIHIAELHLGEHSFEDYTYTDVEELGRKILDENRINYSAYLDEDDKLELANYWENQTDLEKNFIMHCWKSAKEKTGAKTLGFLESSDGSGGTYDADNHYELPFEIGIDEYLQSHGFHLKKEI